MIFETYGLSGPEVAAAALAWFVVGVGLSVWVRRRW